jgi:hypothetical protein
MESMKPRCDQNRLDRLQVQTQVGMNEHPPSLQQEVHASADDRL